MLSGALFGILWQANGNAALGILHGGLAGAGVGWFIAAARSQNESQKDRTNKK